MFIDEANNEQFHALETSLHRPDVRASQQLVDELLAEEFVEFGSSGRVFDKRSVMEALADEAACGSPSPPQVSSFAVKMISQDTVLVTYRSLRPASATQNARQTLRSSIWAMIDGRWQMTFQQGTVVPEK